MPPQFYSNKCKIKQYIFLIFFFQAIKAQDFIFKIEGDANDGKNNYYITLYVGETKKTQTFLLSTTTSLISTQCILQTSQEMKDNSNQIYDTIKEKDLINCSNNTKICLNYPFSSCNKNSKCEFNFIYNNSTMKGLYTKQNISFFEKGDSFLFPTGCSTYETNIFLTNEADGIFGLNSEKNSVLEFLYKEKKIKDNIFSICLNQKNGGYLLLGNIDTIIQFSKNNNDKNIFIYYIPYDIIDNGKYTLDINSLCVEKGNNIIKNGESQKSIIDSISVKTYFTESIYNDLIDNILSFCLNKKGNCKDIQRLENNRYCSNFKSKQEIIKSINNYWPSIIIGFNGYNHILKPENYFIAFNHEGKVKACIGFEKSDENYSILGTTFLNGYNVVFDNENKKIGLVESNCEIFKKKEKIEEEEYINRVFNDPVNVIIVCVSVAGIIVLIILLIILYKIFFNRTPKRKGYARQVDVVNSINFY